MNPVSESLNVVSRLLLPGGAQCGSLLQFLSLNENSANEVTKTHRSTEETPVHTSDVNSFLCHISSSNKGGCKCNLLQ